MPMDQKSEHHFSHQSGRDTSKQSPTTNKTPTQTRKKNLQLQLSIYFLSSDNQREARPPQSAIVHLGRLDCAWDLRVKPKASKLFRDASKLWFHVLHKHTCDVHVTAGDHMEPQL